MCIDVYGSGGIVKSQGRWVIDVVKPGNNIIWIRSSWPSKGAVRLITQCGEFDPGIFLKSWKRIHVDWPRDAVARLPKGGTTQTKREKKTHSYCFYGWHSRVDSHL